MNGLPLRARRYVVCIWILGVLAAFGTRLFPPLTGQAEAWEVGLMAFLGLVAGRVKVRLTPRSAPEDIGSLSLAFALIFATLLRCGPGAAMLVGFLATLSSCVFPKRQPLHQMLFNLGMNAVGTFLVCLIFLQVNGGNLALYEFRTVLAVMLGSLAFFLVNTGTVAGAISLSSGKALRAVWTKTFLWTAPSYFASAVAGLLAVVLFGKHIAFVIGCVTPVAYLTYFSYARSRRQTEHEHQRIQELQIHERQLATELAREHLIAETLQRSMLSTGPEDVMPGLTVATQYEPAWSEALIGGDFFDTVRLPGGRVALVVGDVTGKGLAAATHTAEVKFALRAFLHEYADPGRALERLNRFLLEVTPPNDVFPTSLVTVAVAVLEPGSDDVQLGCAGAESPLLLRADGTAIPVLAGGFPLGTLPDATYESAPIRLESGDRLLMATDGLTEARADGCFFGYEGLVRSAQSARSCSTETLMGQAIIAEAKTFTGGTLQDDVCLLLARRH